ncbi:MAG: pyruvate ferredoxin oxidoreductase [Methanomassiliicoccaceae archaeon]|jgi:pyruvate ferredoxin oxidoreductase alpha subunit|nr:pyruvate ferredoxin oxidoreductase [Methanomassiliicoccaceae archaeon]
MEHKDIAINGDSAIAMAWKQMDPDVCAAYPITPQTIIVERFSDYVADGEVHTEFVCTESEHSALTVCIAAAAAGARTVTATASVGLGYMWEMLGIASGLRVPLTMAVSNRALSAPINIHCDHGDAMASRDTGWLMIFAENVQEAYDNSIMAPRIAEHKEVQLPMMTCLDGFILTHAIERMTPLDSHAVKEFVGEYKPLYPLLDWKNPVTVGAMDVADYYYEHRYQIKEAMDAALIVAEEVFKDFGKLTGRKYKLVETYRCDDAEYMAVCLGSTFGTMKVAVDQLRAEGKKVGVMMPRLYRPLPAEDIAKAVRGKKGVAVLDKFMSPGSYGPLFEDIVASSLSLEKVPKMYGYTYGLGGRDAKVEDLKTVFTDMINGKAQSINYLEVKL